MTDVLELPGLRLRPWQHDDVADVLAAFGDPSIRHYSRAVVDTSADAAHFVDRRSTAWAEREGASWAVTDAATTTVLGHVGGLATDAAP